MLLASSRLSRFLAPTLLGVVAAIVSGCASSGDPQVAPAATTAEQPPSSVLKVSAPSFNSNFLTTKLNEYRRQTYSTLGGLPSTVTHSDVLYTAAYRHAKNLVTTNSAGVTTRPAPGIASSVEVLTITSASTLATLSAETAPATGAQYPLFFTSNKTANRVRAVQGGDDLLFGQSASGSALFENFLFNGNITLNSGLNSAFRGFNQDLFYNATLAIGNDNNFNYDVVDAMWYTRRGRHALMQPTMRQWAYASHNDTDAGMPYPYPILSGRFLGTSLCVADRPLTQQLGIWPNTGNTDVTPYGLDTDLQTILPTVGQDSPYAGPPIHITLPVAEPFSKIVMTFRNLGAYPAGWPNRWKKIAIFSNQDSTIMRQTVLNGFGSVSLPDVVITTAGELIGEVELNTTSANEALNLRDGELFFQTLGPLVPNVQYQLDISAWTAGQGRVLNQTIKFTTNGNSSYAP